MKILQVANGFPPSESAGVELYTYRLSMELRKRHDVFVFCREGDPRRADYEIIDEVINGLPVRRIVNNFLDATELERYYKNDIIEEAFRNYVKTCKPDAIHFQHCIGLSASLPKRAKLMGIPFVLTLHDYWYICPNAHLLTPDLTICPGAHERVNCYRCVRVASKMMAKLRHTSLYKFLKNSLPQSIKQLLLRLHYKITSLSPPPSSPSALSAIAERVAYMKRMLAYCQYITAPSKFVKEIYMDYGVESKKIRVIPLGMNVDMWKGFKKEKIGKIIRFGYIGTLLPHKGVDILLKAFRDLPGSDIELYIYGYGNPDDIYELEVRHLAKHDRRIHFMGRYENEDLPNILKGIDVLVIPSLWHETFSFTAREAVLSCTPVIASKVGAIPEVIYEGKNGYLFPAGDVDALRERMAYLAAQRERIEVLGNQSLSAFKSFQEHVAEIEDLYLMIIEGKCESRSFYHHLNEERRRLP